MSHKVGGMVNLRIDRIYRGVGRIAMSSGTKSKVIFRGIIAMMDDLQERGRLDDLKAIHLKHISPLEAYTKWKEGKLVGIATIAFVKPLNTALLDWVHTYRVAETTRIGYKNNINQLLKVSRKASTVADLPNTLKKYKTQCIQNETLRVFNHTRVTCLAFVRDQYGRNSELWRTIADMPLLDYRKLRLNNPLSVKEVVVLTQAMKPDVAAMVWTMVTTGMGFKEYLDGFTITDNSIIIHGLKNDNRHNRVVPLIYPPARRVLQYKRFREVIQLVRKDVTPYDFRRTYAVWLESSNILKSHRDTYMGHSAMKMPDLYLQQDLTRFLTMDANLLRDWIESEKI